MKQFKITYQGKAYVGIVKEVGVGKVKQRIPFLSIREATTFLGFKHGQYTRRLLHEGKLDKPHPAIRVADKKFSKWFIAIPSLVTYQAARQVRAKGRRYILRIAQGDLDTVRTALEGSKVEYTLVPAYQPKDSNVKASTPKVVEPLEEFTFK